MYRGMILSRLKALAGRKLPGLSGWFGGYSPLYFLESIDLEPIASCNLKCGFCQVPGWQRAKNTRAMEMDRFRKIIGQFPSLHHVKLQGMGEPLMNRNISQMVSYLSERNINTTIVSNAMFLSEDTAGALLERGLTNFYVSIDGATKETYEAARVRSDFGRVTENLATFCRLRKESGHKTFVGVDCLISTPEVLAEVPDLVRLGAEMGVDRVHVKSRIKHWDDGGENGRFGYSAESVVSRYADAKAVMEEARKLGDELGVSFHFSEDFTYSSDDHCPWPWKMAYVSTEGKVVPCCVVGIPESWSTGDLNEETIGQVWNNPEYRQLRKNLLAGELNEYCAGCYRS